ncbi:MAG TPA: hypothetical protein VGI42_05600, partial [Chthoniobacterales bacterium]
MDISIMARRGNSVFGIDLGKHVFKGVLLQRKGDERFVLTSYASRKVPQNLTTPDELAQQLKLLFKDLGGSAKGCAIAISDPDSLLRIIEQPNTPIDLLRNALRLNGLAVLNQECKDFVLDCAPVSAETNGHALNGAPREVGIQNGVAKTKYLVGGMLRPSVKQISEACAKTRVPAEILQLAPICSFNAFEFAYPEIFAKDAFLLLDMGHLQSTVLIGSKKELVLVRSIDYGGKALNEALTADGALDADAARLMIQEGDPGMAEICRTSLA